MISGHIQSGTLNDRDGVCCQFSFRNGVDWEKISVSANSNDLIECRETNLEPVSMPTRHPKQIEESFGTSHLNSHTEEWTSRGGPSSFSDSRVETSSAETSFAATESLMCQHSQALTRAMCMSSPQWAVHICRTSWVWSRASPPSITTICSCWCAARAVK